MLNRKSFLRIFLIFLFLLVIGAFWFKSQRSMKALLVKFTGYAEQLQEEWQVPGMAIAIVKNDKIIYSKQFGCCNQDGTPIISTSIFDIASLTKSFTAALLALQIDEGKYTWHTKVIDLYPEFQLYDPVTTKEFEVRDLIAHDSGLPADSLDALVNFGYRTDQILHALRYIKPVAPFRKEFAYQNVFLEVAKKIIEKSSGESYISFLHKQLFTPLNMTHSFVRTEEILDKEAQPNLWYANKNYPYPKNFPYLTQKWALEPGAAAGGIKSTAEDMAKWLIFNINEGTPLISSDNMNFIHSPQTNIEVGQAYGEGWFIDSKEYKPYNLLYHAGGGTGIHSYMAYIQEPKIGIVVLTNQYTNKVPELLSKRLFDLYFNKKLTNDPPRRIPTDENRIPCEKILVDLDGYPGIYFNPVYGDLVMSKDGDHLNLTIGPQSITWQLTPCGTDVFEIHWSSPPGMDVPMLTGQYLVHFKENGQMIIPLLNGDGSGIFEKKP